VLPPEVQMPHESLNRLIRKLENVTTVSEHERKTILDLPVQVSTLRRMKTLSARAKVPPSAAFSWRAFFADKRYCQTALAQSWRFMCPAKFRMCTAFT
jgi:hypothetical protein